MSYKVLNTFKENNHDGHIYQKGDNYPAVGFEADADRVSYLSQKHRSYGVVFLENSVDGEEEKDFASLSKTELEKVKNDDLKAYLDEKDIEYASNAVKDDLIKLILGEK